MDSFKFAGCVRGHHIHTNSITHFNSKDIGADLSSVCMARGGGGGGGRLSQELGVYYFSMMMHARHMVCVLLVVILNMQEYYMAVMVIDSQYNPRSIFSPSGSILVFPI